MHAAESHSEKPLALKSNDSPSCSALPHPTALIEDETEGGGEEKKEPLWFLGVALLFLARVCSSVSVLRPYCNFSFYHMTCRSQPRRIVTQGFLLHDKKKKSSGLPLFFGREESEEVQPKCSCQLMRSKCFIDESNFCITASTFLLTCSLALEFLHITFRI